MNIIGFNIRKANLTPEVTAVNLMQQITLIHPLAECDLKDKRFGCRAVRVIVNQQLTHPLPHQVMDKFNFSKIALNKKSKIRILGVYTSALKDLWRTWHMQSSTIAGLADIVFCYGYSAERHHIQLQYSRRFNKPDLL